MAKSGVDVLIKLKIEDGTLVVLGGQQSADLNESRSVLDSTTKDSAGNIGSEPGLYSWSIGCNGLIPENREGYRLLKKAVREGLKVTVQVNDGDDLLEGLAVPSELPTSYPYDALSTYSVTLTGDGALNVVTAAE